MSEQQKAKVEKFRITPEMRAFTKVYRQQVKRADMLQQGLMKNAAQGRALMEEAQQVGQGVQQLLQNFPKEQTEELLGQ